MVHIQWKERYNINYKEVDGQHRGLLDILNHLMDLVENKRPGEEIHVIFHRLCAYALEHFTLEERYLKACGYPALDRQKDEHGQFVERILDFNERYDPADPELLVETFNFLKTWYLSHILRSDMEYVPWVKRYHREARLQGIIVEFEGILSRGDPRAFTGALASLSGKPEEEVERLVADRSLLADLQEGALDEASLLEELAQHGGMVLDEVRLLESIQGMHTPVDGSLELLRSLKPRFKLALVADSHPWHAERVIQPCPALDLFDAISLSHEVKARMPDHRLFDDALGRLGLVSEECLFLTSRPDHAEAAERLLFHGHVFRDPETLLGTLTKRAAG